MILKEIMPPEDIGSDRIQIVSTKHVDEYAARHQFQARHIDGALLLAKAEEAAQAAYAHYVANGRQKFQGVAKSASTDLAMAFSMEPQQIPTTVAFVIITAMVKRDFIPRNPSDKMIRISKKTLTFDGEACVEIGRNVYTYASGFAFDDGANACGILQELVVADAQNRKLSPGFCGWLGTEDDHINYSAEVDVHGNIIVSRAWWENIMSFAVLEVK